MCDGPSPLNAGDVLLATGGGKGITAECALAVAKESEVRVSLQLVLETSHLPAGNWVLEYDRTTNHWIASHPDRRIQRMAECFLQSFLEKRGSGQSYIEHEP